MSAADIGEYLNCLDEPKRSTLIRLRADILAFVRDADQCISSAAPGFKVAGGTMTARLQNLRYVCRRVHCKHGAPS